MIELRLTLDGSLARQRDSLHHQQRRDIGTGLEGIATEGVIDLGNTGRFSLVVPHDVTVSSESGRFLGALASDGDADGCDVADIVAANRAIFVPKSSTCARQTVPGP
jgi:hypothetical protein